MRKSLQILMPALLLALALLSLHGCGCGFDCNSDDNNNPTDSALLTLGLSDSLPEDLKEVVIQVDSISFKRSGADAVVVGDFPIGPNGSDVGDFKINLLNYPGTEQLQVIKGQKLDPGTYEVSINVIAAGSSVKEANDNIRPLTVSGGVLTISGMQLTAGSQAFTVEFGLAQALTKTGDTYVMSNTGIRIENNTTAATLSGNVDSTLFNTVSPCNAKSTPTAGNRVYIYQGLQAAIDLVDVFTSASVPKPPGSAVAPFAVASLRQTGATWNYAFGYLPAGQYTLAFACNTAADDAITFNDLVIPQPVTQVYQITLTRGQKSVCNLKEGATCQ